jgi:hypothetical protein
MMISGNASRYYKREVNGAKQKILVPDKAFHLFHLYRYDMGLHFTRSET